MAIETLNPPPASCSAAFPEMGKAEVDRILDRRGPRPEGLGPEAPFAERAVPMRKVAALLLRSGPRSYGRLMALEMGKPLKDGAAEVTKCAWVCEYYAEQRRDSTWRRARSRATRAGATSASTRWA